jgi:hypothetical protein
VQNLGGPALTKRVPPIKAQSGRRECLTRKGGISGPDTTTLSNPSAVPRDPFGLLTFPWSIVTSKISVSCTEDGCSATLR